jgi:hypothetical protein
MTESYMQTESFPDFIRRAKALENVFTKMPIRIEAVELIVGCPTSKLQGGPLIVELNSEWILRELDTVQDSKWETALYPALRPCGLQYAILQPQVTDTTSCGMNLFDTQAQISYTSTHQKHVPIQSKDLWHFQINGNRRASNFLDHMQ